ncbi:hypothetical protein K491DRAFT_776967 [Lophiostoma macrostomum CBS 122681]|uniref:Uncharacterized protein n=1 Tax=Lophiostoma macrostomum CBS 122681 TaxID=1314788 RepID=A0A6A6TD52_9PLEO|nr:hypothetical protein K491DRAFT_776967 [Lophiostoma macrostomum CBS 122681]
MERPCCPPPPDVHTYTWKCSHLYCWCRSYFWGDEPDFYKIWYLVVAAFLVIYFLWAYRRQIQLEEETDIEETKEAAYRRSWKSDRWPSIIGLVEAYFMGKISWAPWNGDSIRERWADKRPMKRFWRAGIIPLHIQPGGCGTYKKTDWKWWKWSFEFPKWMQSKQRAHFVFIIPHYDGLRKKTSHPEHDAARQDFLYYLLAQYEYPVSVSYWNGMHEPLGQASSETQSGPADYPLECGAQSRFKYLLPFKRDRVLAKGLGEEIPQLDHYILDSYTQLPLVSRQAHAVVRVEALDYTPQRLDLWVYDCARTAGLADIWAEDELSRQLGGILQATGLYTGSLW